MEFELENLLHINNISLYAFTIHHGFMLIFILLLLTISALISGAEVAFFSLTPSHIQFLKKSKNRKHTVIITTLKYPEQLLATILITNNFVNIAIIILTSYLTSSLINFTESQLLEFIFKIIIITFLLLLFGEIIPKVYASRFALKFSILMIYPINILKKIFNPFNYILIYISSIFNKKFLKKKKNVSIDEISHALKLTLEEMNEEKDIMEALVRFNNINVSDIMRPRVNVTAIELQTSFNDIIKIIKQSEYSRIPIYAENFDNIKGLLYIKDLLPHIDKKNSFPWQSLIRPPYYVPETKKINALLDEFKKHKIHMAIVVDEYGGTYGIVTMEDILNEIVGDFHDDPNEKDNFYEKMNDASYIFKGSTLLHEFYKILDITEDIFEEEKGEADTLAGILLEIKGEMPTEKEEFLIKNIKFIVKEADKRKIKKIAIQINPSLKMEKTNGPTE